MRPPLLPRSLLQFNLAVRPLRLVVADRILHHCSPQSAARHNEEEVQDMRKGTQAPAPMAKPVEGKKSGDKVSGGEVKKPFAGTPKPGKKVKKG